VEHARDGRFEDERRRYSLRLWCEDCVCFDDEAMTCAHGYPTDAHRRSERSEVISFCKEFEAL
jgi:hypothetical protein